jgi:hypothetical protein
MGNCELAQINIARLVAPIDDPRIADFVAALDSINALAESSPGFVWRLKSDAGNATDIAYNDDPLTIVNMSVWKSSEDLRTFVYSTRHVEILRDRARWFEKLPTAHSCLWWIPEGHIPTVAEGRERLEDYQRNGATERAFWFSRAFESVACS